MAELDSAWLYMTLLRLYFTLCHSTSLYHGSTSLYFILHDSTMAPLDSTRLYISLPWFYLTLLHSTLLYHGSTDSTWLYITESWLYFNVLHSTWPYHGSTSFYITNSSVSEPHTRNGNVSEPHTRNGNVSEPHTRNVNVSEPHTRNVNVSEPHTRNANVSEPHTRGPSRKKSRTPSAEIQTEIQKSRNPLWNPEIHSKIRKSNSGFYPYTLIKTTRHARVQFYDVIECHHMNDLCTRPIFWSGTKVVLLRCCNCNCQICIWIMYTLPRPRAPPSEKGGVWRRDYIMYEQRTCWIFVNHSMRICMTMNMLPMRYVAVKYLWLCILLAYRLRGMQLMNHVYILALS